MKSVPITAFDVTICGIPELEGFCTQGMTHVLSILDPNLDDPEAFQRFAPHERTILRFHDDVRVAQGRVPPKREHVQALLDLGEKLRSQAEGTRLLVHCHMGVSRSTAAVAIILAQHYPGNEAEAFDKIRSIRPFSWPNSRMIGMADEMLGCGGRFVEALEHHQREVLEIHPEMSDLMMRVGRGHEIPEEFVNGD